MHLRFPAVPFRLHLRNDFTKQQRTQSLQDQRGIPKEKPPKGRSSEKKDSGKEEFGKEERQK